MRRLCGFILFWIAVGMALAMFVDSTFMLVLVIVILLLIGYNLFCC